jgi:hypothetical protein
LRRRERSDRWQVAAGEDGGLDEVGVELCAICRDPRRDSTTICVVEQASAVTEEGVVFAPVDCFDHLDRDDLVEGPSDVAVVVREHRHAVLESCVPDTPLREFVLAWRWTREVEMLEDPIRRVDGEAAPAGSDLEHAIAGCKREEVGQPIELVHGRLGQ